MSFIKTYEIYGQNYSMIIQAPSLLSAVKEFQRRNPHEEVIFAENVEFARTNMKKLTDKQLEIEKYLATVEKATLDEIYENVPFTYYHNGNKHLGALLSRMVINGKLERVQRGTFRLKHPEKFRKKYFYQIPLPLK